MHCCTLPTVHLLRWRPTSDRAPLLGGPWRSSQRRPSSARENAERSPPGPSHRPATRSAAGVGAATAERNETGFATRARNPVGARSPDAAGTSIARVRNQLLDVDASAAGVARVEEPRFVITTCNRREIFLREKPKGFALN